MQTYPEDFMEDQTLEGKIASAMAMGQYEKEFDAVSAITGLFRQELAEVLEQIRILNNEADNPVSWAGTADSNPVKVSREKHLELDLKIAEIKSRYGIADTPL